MKTYKLKDHAGNTVRLYVGPISKRLVLRCMVPSLGVSSCVPVRLNKRKAVALAKALLRMAEAL